MEELMPQNLEEEISKSDEISLRKNWINIKKILPNIFNFKVLNICLVAGFCVMFVYYLSLSNILISKGFAINELRTKVENLNKENADSELVVMQLESFTVISDKIAEVGMVGVSDVEYIEVINEAVALK